MDQGEEAPAGLLIAGIDARDGSLDVHFSCDHRPFILRGVTGSQLLHGRTDLAGRLLDAGASVTLVRVPGPEAWERVVAAGFQRSARATLASSLELHALERTQRGLRAWFEVDGRRIPLDLRGVELLSQECVRARLAERLVFVPRVGNDAAWQEKLAVDLGQSPRATLLARAMASILAGRRHERLQPREPFASRGRERLEAGLLVAKGGRLYVARTRLRELLRRHPAWHAGSFRGALDLLEARSHRFGTHGGRRIHAWSFPHPVSTKSPSVAPSVDTTAERVESTSPVSVAASVESHGDGEALVALRASAQSVDTDDAGVVTGSNAALRGNAARRSAAWPILTPSSSAPSAPGPRASEEDP